MDGGSNNLALALGGGGARAAYQVGLLRCLAGEFPDLRIPILTGVSAGAINTAYLANFQGRFSESVEKLSSLWEDMSIEQVFRISPVSLAGNLARWAVHILSGGTRFAPKTRGMVDTAPLRQFLRQALGTESGILHGVAANIRRGRLKAFGVTTTNYATGQSITWVEGADVAMWERPQRRSIPTTMTVEHIMASCALPLFFPAVQLGAHWHGDGGVHLTAPLSPALHLGAERVIAISTRFQKAPTAAELMAPQDYPPPATIIGSLMNSVFLDLLDYDAQHMNRINQLIAMLPEEKRGGLRPVELLVLRPSVDLELLAVEYETELPKTFRFLTRGLGTRQTRTASFLATLLFAPRYIRRLMRIGQEDAIRQREKIVRFVAGSMRAHSSLG
jgi:NTE family protein